MMLNTRKNRYLNLLLLNVIALTGFGGMQYASAQAQSVAEVPAPTESLAGPVAAQASQQVEPEILVLKSIEEEMKVKFRDKLFKKSDIPTLVFSPSQHALLNEARIGFNTRLPTNAELNQALPDPSDPNYRPPPAVRVLTLGGIVFNNPDSWTIYLNNKRVTPEAMPSEAVDLRVYKEFIELRWFDIQTNQIFPVRLRPNQKFNLDGRMFLPG